MNKLMYQAGFKSKAQLAQKLGLHVHTVYRWKKLPRVVELYLKERVRYKLLIADLGTCVVNFIEERR